MFLKCIDSRLAVVKKSALTRNLKPKSLTLVGRYVNNTASCTGTTFPSTIFAAKVILVFVASLSFLGTNFSFCRASCISSGIGII